MNYYSVVSSTFTYGPYRTDAPAYADIALQAGVTAQEAQDMVGAAWAMASNHTRRAYRSVLSGVVLIQQESTSWVPWPVWPEPEEATSELFTGRGWKPHEGYYMKGLGFDLDGQGLYRLTQVGMVAAPEIPAQVIEAVRCLALYLLIHSPQRREMRSQQAGDSSFTRVSSMGVLYGSGAGAMLAGEVLAGEVRL